jgi:hypothetical protein
MAGRSRRKNDVDSAESEDFEAVQPRRSTRKTSQPPVSTAEQDAVASSMPPPVTKGRHPKAVDGTSGPSIPRRGVPRKAREKSASLPTVTSAADHDERTSSAAPFWTPNPGEMIREAAEDDEAGSGPDSDAERKQRMAIMKVMLPGLYKAADDLHNILLQPSPDMQDVAIRLLKEPFQSYRAGFMSKPGEAYLDLDDVLQTLAVDNATATAGLVSRIIVLANLITLLDDLTSAEAAGLGSQRMVEFLNTLEAGMPLAFVHMEDDGKQHINDDMLHLALRIRIQRFLEAFRHKRDRGRPVLDLVGDAFFTTRPNLRQLRGFANGVEDDAISPFKAFGGLGPESPGLEAFWSEYHEQVQAICLACEESPEINALRKLEGSYRQDDTLKDVRKWTRTAFAEVEGDPGGKINDLLHLYYAGRLDRATQIRGAEPEHDSRADSRRPAERLAAPASGQQVPISSYDIIDHQRDLETDHNGRAVSTTAQDDLPAIEDVLAGPSRLAAGSSSLNRNKRMRAAAADGDKDGEEDDGFETDNRAPRSPKGKEPMRAPKRARQEPPTSGQRQTAASSSNPAPQSVLATIEPNSQYQLREPSQLTEGSARLNLHALSQATKFARLAVQPPAAQRRRVPWSDEDAETLLRAIAVHGARWAELEKLYHAGQIPLLDPRDQQAMRDKARLMKMHFLM